MTDSKKLMREFMSFKKETENRFKEYPLIDKDILKQSLTGVLREQEKINILNKILITGIVSGIIIILLIVFLIYIMLFTTPIGV